MKFTSRKRDRRGRFMEAFIHWFRAIPHLDTVKPYRIHAFLQLALTHPELAQGLIAFARQHKEYVKAAMEEDVASAQSTVVVEHVMGS